MLENKYSNTYAVDENKNYKFVKICRIDLCAALKAEVEIYINQKETLETTRSCVLNVKWSNFNFDNPYCQSWIQIYDFVPQTDRELQLYLDGYWKGILSEISNVSSRTFPDDMINLFEEINNVIQKRQNSAVEEFIQKIEKQHSRDICIQ